MSRRYGRRGDAGHQVSPVDSVGISPYTDARGQPVSKRESRARRVLLVSFKQRPSLRQRLGDFAPQFGNYERQTVALVAQNQQEGGRSQRSSSLRLALPTE